MYLIAYLVVILAVSFICFAGFIPSQMGLTQTLNSIIDFPTILILLAFLIPSLIVTGYIKDLNNAFRFSFTKKTEGITLIALKRALEAVKLTNNILLYSGGFIALVSFIFILHMLSDPAALGPSISKSFAIMLYAVFLSLLLQPVKSMLNIMIMDYIHEE